MENLSIKSSDSDLEQVKSEFQLWRSQQLGRRIIPQYLWHKAIALLKTYPLALVVRQLGVSRDRLIALSGSQTNLATSTLPSSFNSLPTFLQISSSDLNTLASQHPNPNPSSNSTSSPSSSSNSTSNSTSILPVDILAHSEQSCRIVIEKSDGSRLSIQLSTNFSTIEALCNTFLKG